MEKNTGFIAVSLLIMLLLILPIAHATSPLWLYCQIYDPDLNLVKSATPVSCDDCDDNESCDADCSEEINVSCEIICESDDSNCCSKEGDYTYYVYLGTSNDPAQAVETESGSGSTLYTVDWDTQTYCTQTCTGKFVEWGIGGEASGCCGDDSGEYMVDCQDNNEGLCAQASDNKACCDMQTDCVYNNNCYSLGGQTGEWKCGAGADSIWHDTVPPWRDIKINNDSFYTDINAVVLSLNSSDNGTGVLECGIANEDGVYEWESCSAGEWGKNWTLSMGEGVKTVFFQVKDKVGNSAISSDTIVLDITGPVTWIDPPLPEWMGPANGKWNGSEDGSVKAFNVSAGYYDAAGMGCYQFQYRVGASGEWKNWTIEDTNCTPRSEWAFGPDKPVEVKENEPYYFRVMGIDKVGRPGEWSPDNHTKVDVGKPDLNIEIEMPSGLSSSGEAGDYGPRISMSDNVVTIKSSASDALSGIESHYIRYCTIYEGGEDCKRQDCPQKGPGELSECEVSIPYGENMIIKYRAAAMDYAGNAEYKPGKGNTYFYITNHKLANFAVHYLDIIMGESAVLKVYVRNLKGRFDNVTVSLTGYESASFADTGVAELGDDRRAASVGLNPYEEKEIFVKVYSSSIGQFKLFLSAISLLTKDGSDLCSGMGCEDDSDTAYITIGYLTEFPGLNIWGILLLVAVSLIIYCRVDGKPVKG